MRASVGVINKPWRSPKGSCSVRVRSQPVTIDPRPPDESPVAQAIVELLQEQIRLSGIAPKPATMARTPGRKPTILVNTGRFVRGLFAKLSGDTWQTLVPPDRMRDREVVANVREALARVVDMPRLVRDKRYRLAQVKAWRKGIKVGRMQG